MTNKEINLLHRDIYVKYGPAFVDLISTHASWVLLSPDYAYKIKKPVKFSFLDFSTLDKRKNACEDELVLNRRLTKDMYLEVVSVSEQEGHYFLAQKKGQIIDYALKMKRMDPSLQMDRLIEKGQVHNKHIEAIATQLATFHQSTKRLYDRINLDILKEQFNDIAIIQPFLAKEFDSKAAALIPYSIQLSDQFLDKHIDRLLERQAAHWVIDGHGDLHSRNIFLMEEPIIFDCIEFNEDFRIMDILNEIAFFCMDLDYYGRQDLVADFMNHYLGLIPCIQDIADWNIFHYFKLYRANVRLKVYALNAMQIEKEEELSALKPTIQAYLDLYQYYLKALS